MEKQAAQGSSGFAPSAALGQARQIERERADALAARFLVARDSLVREAESRAIHARAASPGKTRMVLAAAAVLLVVSAGVIPFAHRFRAGADLDPVAAGVSNAAAISSAAAFESRLLAARAGSVIRLEAGSIETVTTLRKPVRLVAVDGPVRIGVVTSKENGV